MKCKFCRAEIEHDAQFCTNCGKDLSIFDKCVKCGKLLDSDTVFCPYCGTEQPKYEDSENLEERSSYTKIFIAILGILILGGLCYYLSSRSSIDNIGDTNKSIVETSVTKSKESYADDNSKKNSTETSEEVTTTQPEIEASVNETEKYISFKDILETNGEIEKLVKKYGFESGSNMSFHNYVCKNVIVDDAFVRPSGKGLPIMINCQFHPSYVDFDIMIYDISDFQKFKKDFLKYSKKTGDTYQFSWPNGTVVKDVKVLEENDHGSISWSEDLYLE